jgi:hypothetical protein
MKFLWIFFGIFIEKNFHLFFLNILWKFHGKSMENPKNVMEIPIFFIGKFQNFVWKSDGNFKFFQIFHGF